MNKKTSKRSFYTRKPLTHSVSIPVPAYDSSYPGYTKAIDWCKANCRGSWQYNQNGEFLFERESDLAFFSHVWRR